MRNRRVRLSLAVLVAIFAHASCAFPTRPIAPPGEQDRDASSPPVETCEPDRCAHPDANTMPSSEGPAPETENPAPMNQRSMGSSASNAFEQHFDDGDSGDAGSDATGIVIEGGAPMEGTNSQGPNPRLGR